MCQARAFSLQGLLEGILLHMKIYCLIALILISVITTKAQDSGEGRYRLYEQTGGVHFMYLIDTQTGRVWHETIDEQTHLLVMYPMLYKSGLTYDLSFIPNETNAIVHLQINPPTTTK